MIVFAHALLPWRWLFSWLLFLTKGPWPPANHMLKRTRYRNNFLKIPFASTFISQLTGKKTSSSEIQRKKRRQFLLSKVTWIWSYYVDRKTHVKKSILALLDRKYPWLIPLESSWVLFKKNFVLLCQETNYLNILVFTWQIAQIPLPPLGWSPRRTKLISDASYLVAPEIRVWVYIKCLLSLLF